MHGCDPIPALLEFYYAHVGKMQMTAEVVHLQAANCNLQVLTSISASISASISTCSDTHTHSHMAWEVRGPETLLFFSFPYIHTR